MSKYAKIENNLVVNVILCEDNVISSMPGAHIKITSETKEAAIGYTFDTEILKFIAPKPYDSWILNDSFEWESPQGANPDVLTKIWNEESQSWVDQD